MAHKRSQIRDAVVALLVAGDITDVEAKVYPHRSAAVMNSEVPLIIVQATDESVERPAINAPSYWRAMLIEVIVCDNGIGDEAMVEAVETIAAEVEDLMEASSAGLDALTEGPPVLKQVQVANKTEEQTIAGLKLTYEIKYQTRHS